MDQMVAFDWRDMRLRVRRRWRTGAERIDEFQCSLLLLIL